MGLGAVLLAALAPGLLWVLFGWPFRKRGCLPLARPSRLVNKLFELGDTRLKLHHLGFEFSVARFEFSVARFELSDLPIFLGDGLKELFVGRLGHPGRSRRPLPCGVACTNSNPIG